MTLVPASQRAVKRPRASGEVVRPAAEPPRLLVFWTTLQQFSGARELLAERRRFGGTRPAWCMGHSRTVSRKCLESRGRFAPNSPTLSHLTRRSPGFRPTSPLPFTIQCGAPSCSRLRRGRRTVTCSRELRSGGSQWRMVKLAVAGIAARRRPLVSRDHRDPTSPGSVSAEPGSFSV
jgi:hypothetical protein